jgi:3-hydroxyisobutyrate dehydrogenase-like beta-hydroxyacid dehydrogenase
MLEQDDEPDFSLDMALKDLDLATSEGGTEAAPLAVAMAERWRGLVQNGWRGFDVSAARHGLGSDGGVQERGVPT